MRPLRIAAFAIAWSIACSGKGDEPRERPQIREEGRRSIDVTVDPSAKVTIRGVEVKPSGRGDLELGYRVEGAGHLTVPGEIKCRVGPYNLVYPATATGKVAGPRLTGLFRAEPFTEISGLCEIRFFIDDPRRPIARACYTSDGVIDGACPAGSFSKPALATSYLVDVARATFKRQQGSVALTALFTLGGTLAPGRSFATTLSCKDRVGAVNGEGDLAFLQLDHLGEGESVFGPLAILIDRALDDTVHCELTFVSRASAGSADEETHGSYCLTRDVVRAGPCAPN